MRNRALTTLALVALLVAAVALGVVSFPSDAEAYCYPWEYESRLVFEGLGDCCSAVRHGGEYIYREERRYRNPDCSWGSWQDSGYRHIYCVQDTCYIA
jgi:hypothetical protein